MFDYEKLSPEQKAWHNRYVATLKQRQADQRSARAQLLSHGNQDVYEFVMFRYERELSIGDLAKMSGFTVLELSDFQTGRSVENADAIMQWVRHYEDES